MKHDIFEKVLNDVSLDPRIENGTFNLEENEHMDILREYFTKRGVNEALTIEFTNKVIEGKYPERQAFNAKGILVTFPTPEYKQKAIQKGTHFEQDPTKAAPNIFAGGDQQAPEQGGAPAPTSDDSEKTGDQPKTSLPLSQTSTDTTQPQAAATKSTAAPQQTPTTGQTPDPTAPPEPPPPPPVSAAEKEANKDVIKKMLKGDDYMLEQVVSWFINNAPQYLQEQIERHKKLYER